MGHLLKICSYVFCSVVIGITTAAAKNCPQLFPMSVSSSELRSAEIALRAVLMIGLVKPEGQIRSVIFFEDSHVGSVLRLWEFESRYPGLLRNLNSRMGDEKYRQIQMLFHRLQVQRGFTYPRQNPLLSDFSRLNYDLDSIENALELLLAPDSRDPRRRDFQIDIHVEGQVLGNGVMSRFRDNISAAAEILLFELRHPGYLTQQKTSSDWEKYRRAREMFAQVRVKFGAYLMEKVASPAN